jgi:hypothetical protein
MYPAQGMQSTNGQADSPLALPANLPNAWCDQKPYDPPAFYASLGYIGLFRQYLGKIPAIAYDAASGGIDTGAPPSAATPIIATFHDVSPAYMSAPQVMVGYHTGTEAFEASGFYFGQATTTKTYASAGHLDSFFNVGGSFSGAPLGFEGDNGMWLQSDVMTMQFKTSLGSAEASYRSWGSSDSEFSWSIGIRFVDLYERFGFYSGDDDITVRSTAGLPNPIAQATYQVTAHNDILAPQLGVQWEKAINCYLAFNLMAKGAWGANFKEVDTLLQRGDGFIGFKTNREDTIFSQLYQMGLNLDVNFAERARLRFGYQFLWIVDVAEATGQFNYDLSHIKGTTNNNGSIFYHGPMVEVHVLF